MQILLEHTMIHQRMFWRTQENFISSNEQHAYLFWIVILIPFSVTAFIWGARNLPNLLFLFS